MKKQVNRVGRGKICLGVLPFFIASLAFFACGGSDGANGRNGTNASIQTSAEPAGEHCPSGGIKIEVLQDGVVQEGQTQYICSGNNGEGNNGTNATIQTSDEPAGENCANGGIKIEVLVDGEVQAAQTKYVCNGVDGGEDCQPGWHNGGDGVCVLKNTCSIGYLYSKEERICRPFQSELIDIPAGSFIFNGATVTVAAFKLGRTPVTVGEFEKCVEAGKCTSDHYNTFSHSRRACNYGNENRKIHPMNCVDWDGAGEYCKWAGGRLPTEEEWEYAATHNGTEHLNTSYPWGDDASVSCEKANYNECYGGTSPVGVYSPAGDSPLGLIDMMGNVWEWTDTLYPSDSSIKPYVIKGGSWGNSASKINVTFSDRYYPSNWDSNLGFRCAK